MSKYQDQLLSLIRKDELKIRPIERKNEMIAFYEQQGLNDVAFSRKNVKWGIPIPWDETHTVYVWADAFLNYLTGLGWDGSAGEAPEYWPAQIQLMSKDILRVHATIWPAMLLALGLPVMKELFIHGYFVSGGQKMSKSIGNVISPEELMTKYGVDATRYLLLSATVFGSDGDITWEKFDFKYNADLANGLGNLVSRVIAMDEKYFDSKIPEFAGTEKFSKAYQNAQNDFDKSFENVALDKACDAIIDLVNFANGYISEVKPWEQEKNQPGSSANDIGNLLELVRRLGIMIAPFMPETSGKIVAAFEVEGEVKRIDGLFMRI